MEEYEQGFTIDTDGKAEWALTKIKEEEAETQRLVNICKEKIEEYEMKIQVYQGQHENKIAYFKGLLNGYFNSVPHKATKTQESYSLPSGKLRLKYPTPKFDIDEEVLADYLADNGFDDYLKVIPRPQWGTFKKTVEVVGDKVVDENGQIVQGVTVTMTQPEFEVEI